MREEIWKDIPNYEGYQVSNLGQVRTHNKTTYTKRHGIRHWKDRILKQKTQTKRNGRKDCRVELWSNGKHKTILVARLVAFTFYNKDINSNLTVDHIDGNTLNNDINNLELVSLRENIKRGFENNLYTSQKRIKLTNKNNNYDRVFRSMAEASKIMNKNHGYISQKIKKNIYENDNFRWELF